MKKTISGIRGIFGSDLTIKETMEFCNNFSSLIKSKKCIISRDTRPSGEIMKGVASAVLQKNGIDVYDLGLAPTPVAFRESRKYGSGIIVTSSHNPIEWNGLKFILDGRGINESELPEILKKQNIQNTKIGDEEKISSNYVQEAKEVIGENQQKSKIIIDVGGGAAKNYAAELLKSLGCEVNVINNDLKDCNRGPDPTSDKLDEITTKSKNYDIGFAFDLDGDRVVVVKDGIKQTPDVTLGLGIAKTLQLGFKKFVISIDTSVAIEKFIKDHGGIVDRSKVGEANVIEQIIKTNADAGGEGSSAGFIFPKFNYCRDGILTAGFVSSMLHDKTYFEILKFMESFYQLREKTKVDSNLHDSVIEEVSKKFNHSFSEVNTIDGIKGVIDENSWVLIRKSNTEDIIRISAESNNIEKCKKIIQENTKLVNDINEKIR